MAATRSNQIDRLIPRSPARPVPWLVAVIALIVLFLAILNPLLCLIHCTQTYYQSPISIEQESFICDFGHDRQAGLSAPFEKVWNGIRAVYEALPGATMPLTIVAVMALLIAVVGMAPLQPLAAPKFPPPKRPGFSQGS